MSARRTTHAIATQDLRGRRARRYLLDELKPRTDGTPHRSLIEFVTDRPGHDFRYAIDPTKIETELGWKATVRFADGIRKTIEWYIANQQWTDDIRSGAYRSGI